MIIIGHRGARKEAPENTVEGFIWAQQNGCRDFELDIQLSRDHELMVFHDTALLRTTGRRGRMSAQNAAILKTLDARRSTPGWRFPTRIPRLQDILDVSPHCRSWQFEVKTDSRHRLSILADKLSRLIYRNSLTDSAVVTSSNRWFLKHFSLLHPNLKTGYVAEWSIPDPVTTACILNCSLLCLNNALASEERIAAAHGQGLVTSVWTVNNLARMRELQSFGVDSVITDIPSTAIEAFDNQS